MKLRAPALLTDEHILDDFQSGVASLDDWLRRRALANQVSGASRTYVVATEDRHVLGYYSLASGGLALAEAPGGLRRNMPDPIPMAVLGRLAVHHGQQRKGLAAIIHGR